MQSFPKKSCSTAPCISAVCGTPAHSKSLPLCPFLHSPGGSFRPPIDPGRRPALSPHTRPLPLPGGLPVRLRSSRGSASLSPLLCIQFVPPHPRRIPHCRRVPCEMWVVCHIFPAMVLLSVIASSTAEEWACR